MPTSIQSKLLKTIFNLTHLQRNCSHSLTTTTSHLSQPNLINEARLEKFMADEENNRTILCKFLENYEASSTRDDSLALSDENRSTPLTSAMIEKARKRKSETGMATYRKIVYSEGELDNSCFDHPPSISNPHPFDPSVLPPVHSHTVVPFVNHSQVLRLLVDIGVDLSEIEMSTTIGRYIMRLRMEDIKEKVEFMQKEMGFKNEQIGGYLTRNPYFLLQNVDDMQVRLNYLEMKKFSRAERTKIVLEYRYWLNCNVELIDSRLGWMQKNFKLTAKATRQIIAKEPRIIMFGVGPLERLLKMFSKELNFTDNQLKILVLEDPRLFMMDPNLLLKTYRYVRDVMRINNATIILHPFILRCSLSVIRLRHEFLKKLGRAHYEMAGKEGSWKDKSAIQEGDSTASTREELVILENFLSPSDAVFAVSAAKTYPVVYDKFLRSS